MRSRPVVHLAVFAVLAGAGAWIAYHGVVAPGRYGPLYVDLELTAMVWFALLIYAFIGLLLYHPLRRRSWRALLAGHGFALTIALASTAVVVMLGRQHSAEHNGASTQSSELERAPEDGSPSAQPLPLPRQDEAAPPPSDS